MHLVDASCRNPCAENRDKVCISKWRTIYLFFVHFFSLSWHFPRHDSLWLGSQSLFPFLIFFSAFVSHSCQLSSGPSSCFSGVISDSCWTQPHCSEKDCAPRPVKISQYDIMKDQKCPLLHTMWRSGSIFIFEVSPALRRRYKTSRSPF